MGGGHEDVFDRTFQLRSDLLGSFQPYLFPEHHLVRAVGGRAASAAGVISTRAAPTRRPAFSADAAVRFIPRIEQLSIIAITHGVINVLSFNIFIASLPFV